MKAVYSAILKTRFPFLYFPGTFLKTGYKKSTLNGCSYICNNHRSRSGIIILHF